jgi:hypothetical protein
VEELHRHIQSPLYLQILAAIDLASELPEICFQEVASSQGLELIEALRTCGKGNGVVAVQPPQI